MWFQWFLHCLIKIGSMQAHESAETIVIVSRHTHTWQHVALKVMNHSGRAEPYRTHFHTTSLYHTVLCQRRQQNLFIFWLSFRLFIFCNYIWASCMSSVSRTNGPYFFLCLEYVSLFLIGLFRWIQPFVNFSTSLFFFINSLFLSKDVYSWAPAYEWVGVCDAREGKIGTGKKTWTQFQKWTPFEK